MVKDITSYQALEPLCNVQSRTYIRYCLILCQTIGPSQSVLLMLFSRVSYTVSSDDAAMNMLQYRSTKMADYNTADHN